MGVPISIRLDDDVRHELETRASREGIGLATLIRDLATGAARDVRRTRIREASARVADRVAVTRPGRDLYEAWGTPRADAG